MTKTISYIVITKRNVIFFHAVVTIKDFSGSKEDKSDDAKQREKDQIMLAEKMAKSSVSEKLNEVKMVEDNIKRKNEMIPDLNDIEFVTSDQNIYYELW